MLPTHPIEATVQVASPQSCARSTEPARGRGRTILFALHRVPYPPDKGEKVRAHHELCVLARRGYRVHLVAFVDSERDLRAASALDRLCASVQLVRRRPVPSALNAASRIVRGGPLSLGYFGSSRMARAIRRVLDQHKPDGVLAYSSPMAQYIPAAWWSKTVFDMVDADSEKWRALSREVSWPRSWIFRTEATRLAAYEGRIVREAHCTVVTTSSEADVLFRNHGASIRDRVRVMANAVDLGGPDAASPGECHNGDELRRQPALVFAGTMDYGPNVDGACYFAKEILPLVREKTPAVLWIVGRDPDRRVRRLAADPAVRVTGYVADVRPYLSAAAVAVVPIRIARGIQTKLLEAMAAGCAVVCTPEVNAAVGAADGEQVLVANSPRAFADAVTRALSDRALRTRLGTSARAFIRERYGILALDRALEAAITAAIAQPTAEIEPEGASPWRH